MAPGGGGKRKRGDRTYSHDSSNDGSRPSPHRPGNLQLAQQSFQQPGQQQHGFGREQQEQRGRGGRRGSRAGQGGGRGGGPPRSPMNSPNAIPVQPRPTNTPSKAMSPPPLPAQRSEELKQAAPRLPTPTSVVRPQTPVQDVPSPSPYNFEHLTKERLDTWNLTGRKTIVDIGVQARIDEDPLLLGALFQEVVKAGLEGRMDPTDAGTVIKEILGDVTRPNLSSVEAEDSPHPLPFDAQSLFLDCLSVLTEIEHTHPSLKIILHWSMIPSLLMRQELESPFLESLGMIRNTFVRVGIRQQTNLLYRQSNYNLLREETEGYSKLITELFTTSSNEPPTSDVVEDTFERVKGMIGAFDLDVGRVLDVTLDVFAAVLVKQYRFFVKYLRASSWWPQEKGFPGVASDPQCSGTLPKWALPGSSGWTTTEDEREELASARDERDKLFWEQVRAVGMSVFFEIGGRRPKKSTLEAVVEHGNDQDTSQPNEDRKWIEATGTLPPSGNKVAAQVLGFKLRFYSSSARDPNDVLPVNLIYLAALLIKVGFISLRDLYPHLWPADEAMEAVKEEKMKEKVERERLNRPGGGAMNALMTAGALADDTLPALARLRETDDNRAGPLKVEPFAGKEKASTPAPVEEKEKLPEPSDQKVQLLKSLLCIGALPESLYMLGRFPWLVDAFPDLPEHIHRILHHCLSKVYEPLQPLRELPGLREQQKLPDPDQSGVPKGQVRLIDAPARKVLRWAQLDKDDTNEGMDYRFYWDDWADNIPVCQSVDDVFLLCGTLLNYTGVKIGQDPALLLKLARIGNHSLANDSSDANLARWTDLSKRLLVPALSLTRCNPGVVNEMFELIKHFSTPIRYSIYAEWYSGQTSRLPDIKAAFDQARAETKDVLKRISKTNVKPMARALAKVAYASPGIVFSVAIAQIESYDNLVEVVVECARYFTYLGYDVLTWSLMSSLGGKGRNRVQADGMLTSRWLQALSLFAGKVFKRYSIMSPTPILQYVTDQLRRSNSTDLIVLEEITSSMAGIVSDTNFNEAQVLSMAGGEVLQAQTMLRLLDRRHESKTTARRLMKSLVEPRLAGQLLVSIAQERQTCVFKIPESDAHLKLLGNLFDEIHRVLTQYLDLLRSNMSIKDFDALVPDVSRLIGEFGIEPNVAFWISRPSIAAAVAEADAEAAKQTAERKEPQNVKTSGEKEIPGGGDIPDVDMDDDKNALLGKLEANAVDILDGVTPMANDPPDGDQKDLEMKDVSPPASSATPSAPAKVNGVQQPWHPVLQVIIDSIRPALPEQTWEVLSVPFYVTFWQLSLRDMLVPTQSYEDEISRQKKKIVAINSDRTDISLLGTQKKEREKKYLNDVQDRLRAEMKDHISTYSQTRSRLQKEKDHWFAGAWGKWDAINTALIEHCFFPRILVSPVDAMYAFKMLKFLHSSGAANFRTMGVLDHFFREKRLTSLIFVCTLKEADNVGRFLHEVLRDLGRWHADKAIFEKEAFGTKKDLPGFAKKLSSEKVIDTFMDFEEFRRILLKWHRNLNSALKTCLSGGEYMHIRNAIIVLKAIYQYFPAVNWMGQSQVASITELSKSESREDLKIAATSLLGNLKRREREWVLPQAFNLNESLNGTNGARAGSARPVTPQPAAEPARTLRAEAAEFQPGRRSVDGSPRLVTTASGKLEVEDGEIEDAKMADAATTSQTPAVTIQHSQFGPDEPTPTGSDSAPALTKSVLPQVKNQDLGSQPVNELPSQPGNRTPTPQSPPPQAPREELKPVSTAAGNQPSISIPARPDLPRSTPNFTNSRAQHSLPSRPEALPSRGNDHRTDRPGDRGSRELPRDVRYSEHGRNDRAIETSRERVPERQAVGGSSRGYDRAGERPMSSDRERTDAGWAGDKTLLGRSSVDDRYGGPNTRDSRLSPWDERLDRPLRDRPIGEPLHNARNAELQGHTSRDSPMAPPRSNIPQHPDRAALIHGGQESERGNGMSNNSERRPEPSRYDSHQRAEWGSRPPSPLRREDRRPRGYDSRNEDRSLTDGRRLPSDFPHSHPSRYEEFHPPTAPRVDRPGATNASGPNDRAREIIRPTAPAAPPADPNHGRLNYEPSGNARQVESQYGRLNPGSDVPLGPRLTNGTHPPSNRGGHNISAPQPPINTQQTQASSNNHLPSPTLPDRQAPTGPASTRGGTRSSTQFSRPPSAPSSAPPTPVTEAPDTGGIHPDRLKTIQRSEALQPSNPPSQGNASRTMNNEINSSVSAQQQPPVGPRAPNDQQPPSPIGPPLSNRNPPTGPSLGGGGRGRGDKRFADIQNVLQQAGSVPSGPDTRSGQGASIRGRGGRANNANVNAAGIVGSAPPTPGLMGRSDPLMARSDAFPARADLFAGRASGGSTPQHHGDDEQAYGRGGRRDSGRDSGRDSAREGGERRSTRHGRASRDHSTDWLPPGAPLASRQEEERGQAPRRDEHRESRSRGGGAPVTGDRDAGRNEFRDRERRADSDRRNMDEWGAHLAGGGPGPDRRDERERRDGGSGMVRRKRGHVPEDGPPERGLGDGKRPRRPL